MEWEDSSTPMEMYIQENGKMIRRMAEEFIYTKMAQSIMEIGFRICNTGLGDKNGLTAHHMKGIPFIYIRHYQNGTKNGEGIFVWKNGDTY